MLPLPMLNAARDGFGRILQRCRRNGFVIRQARWREQSIVLFTKKGYTVEGVDFEAAGVVGPEGSREIEG